MPTYNYLRQSTGEEWTEVRKIANRLDGCDDDVILLLSTPLVGDPTRNRAAGKAMEKKFDRLRKTYRDTAL
jgi:hypothetical protein